MPVSDQRLESCVHHFRTLLNDLPIPPRALSQAPSSRLGSIVNRVGAERRSDLLLQRLANAFEASGMITHPRLVDHGLENDDWIYFLDAEHPIKGLTPVRRLFHDEAELEKFIIANQDRFDRFGKLGLTPFQRQQVLDGGRRIDLLATRPSQNQLVGVELKLGEPDDRSVGQLEQYLDDLAEHAKRHGYDSAHLIVVTGQPDETVKARVQKYADVKGHTVSFMLYRVELELTDYP